MQKLNLLNDWGIWFSYTDEKVMQSNQYSNKLKKVHQIYSVQDLIYAWRNSYISSLTNFFLFSTQQSNECYKYKIDEKYQVVNSINFFKKDISPSWEDKANCNGGRLVFNIEKSQNNFQQIYVALVFFFLGENFAKSENINGIRFISGKSNTIHKYYFRVQIWVNFNKTSMDDLDALEQVIQEFHQENEIINMRPMFKDNAMPKEGQQKAQK